MTKPTKLLIVGALLMVGGIGVGKWAQSIHQHSVTLTWKLPSSPASPVASYNIYRAKTHGGPYDKIATSKGERYIDTNVEPGETYYYVTTSVDATGKESGYSEEIKAVIPK